MTSRLTDLLTGVKCGATSVDKIGSDTDLRNQAHAEMDENGVCPMLDMIPAAQRKVV